MIRKHVNLIKIGDQIRTIRSSKGFSQEGLAAAATLGRTYMGRVERGEQKYLYTEPDKNSFYT